MASLSTGRAAAVAILLGLALFPARARDLVVG